MKSKLTAAAWRTLLNGYEKVMNVLVAGDLQPHEREALLCVHHLLRTQMLREAAADASKRAQDASRGAK